MGIGSSKNAVKPEVSQFFMKTSKTPGSEGSAVETATTQTKSGWCADYKIWQNKSHSLGKNGMINAVNINQSILKS